MITKVIHKDNHTNMELPTELNTDKKINVVCIQMPCTIHVLEYEDCVEVEIYPLDEYMGV